MVNLHKLPFIAPFAHSEWQIENISVIQDFGFGENFVNMASVLLSLLNTNCLYLVDLH